MRYTFNFYGPTVVKKGRCAICSKRGQIKKKFQQSINPWNQKTILQIIKEVEPKALKWLEEPFVHEGCEREKSLKELR